MPSLYNFSAVDAASAVDYSRDIDDGVVNSPPPISIPRSYAPSPSPLSREKRTLVRLGRASSSTDDGVIRRGPSRRLSLDPPLLQPSPVEHIPPLSGLIEVAGPPPTFGGTLPSIPHAPVNTPVAAGINVPKTKVNSTPRFFVPRRHFHGLAYT